MIFQTINHDHLKVNIWKERRPRLDFQLVIFKLAQLDILRNVVIVKNLCCITLY